MTDKAVDIVVASVIITLAVCLLLVVAAAAYSLVTEGISAC